MRTRILAQILLGVALSLVLSACSEDETTQCVDTDGDGYFVGLGCEPLDCDDGDPAIHPGATEVCGNDKDEDCQNGDEPCEEECTDPDNDQYGEGKDCKGPDCSPNDPNINPGATEICGNDKDDDCKGGDEPCPVDCIDPDEDQYGEGKDCLGPDCVPNDKDVHPGATEICGNGKDDDCQGGDASCLECVDTDGDHYGDGKDCLGIDCKDDNPAINPGAVEDCGDQLDNDCDGQTDGDDSACSCVDSDQDGYQDKACGGDDCVDNDKAINPGATEICGNGKDDDCQGGDSACACGQDCGLGNLCDIGTNTCRPMRIEEYWAPVFYQDVDASCGECDSLTRYNFDGDDIGNNNWVNFDNFPKKAVVYYSVVESETHYFIGYYLFHARNSKNDYANEMKGVVLVIRKGQDFGELVLMETETEGADGRYLYQYLPNGSTLKNSGATKDGEFHFSQGGGHTPIVYVKSKGHELFGDEDFWNGVGRWERDGFPGGDGLVYRYQQEEGEPLKVDPPPSQEVSYKLVGIADSLWLLRNEIGTSKMFDQFGRFNGGERQGDYATAPWLMEDVNENSTVPTGTMFYNPVDFFDRQFSGFDPWSKVYLSNPYALKITAIRYKVSVDADPDLFTTDLSDGYLRIVLKDSRGREWNVLDVTYGVQNSWYGDNNTCITADPEMCWFDLATTLPNGRNYFYGFDYPEMIVDAEATDVYFGIESRDYDFGWSADDWLMQPKERKYYLFTGTQTLDWTDSLAEIGVELSIAP